METIWEEPQLRQQILNQFGNSVEAYCQFYHFEEKIFYFSDNIKELIGDISNSSFSLEQWYQVIYEGDRHRLQRYVKDMFHIAEEGYSFNYRLRDWAGQLVWVTSKGKCTFDEQGQPKYFLGFLVASKGQRDNDEEIRQAAFLQELKALHSQGEEGYLLIVNVDDLSQINLKCGREFGDGVLRDLEESMGSADSRFSCPFRTGHSSLCTLAAGVSRETVETYFHTLQQEMQAQCTLSGGCVSLQEFQVPDSDMLLHYAASALDAAKLDGKNQLVFFTPEDYERRLAAIELQTELEVAVKEGFSGFSLLYQPQVRSETFELASAEALLRFHSPRRGMVSPAEFVPILERSGLIIPVGQWVLRTALAQCRVWRQELPTFRVSVNVSYVQLRHPEIQTEVFSALRESGLPGSALTIEVTEGFELQEYGYLNTIFNAWKKEGVEISVDDFGTGYSSLGWLKKLAIDEIKIDRCFVSGIQHSAYNLRLLSNIIEVAQSGFLRVCCEGVETSAELAVLEPLQPALYQGFFFSKPIPPEAFAPNSLQQRFLERRRQVKHDSYTEESSFECQTVLEHAVLEKTEDAITVCDTATYELYYLNPTAQRIFGVRNYRGRKCYQALRGRDTPCDFCPNAALRRDSFYIWEDRNEYCDRHFLLKDKLLDIGDRTVRFQVAMDITKQEYVSQKTQERLEFANRIAGYAELLGRQENWRKVVNVALAAMGEFYKADRAYLFEEVPGQSGYWSNTFEWCAPEVIPQKDNLQQVPPEAMERWMEAFRTQGSVIFYNLEPLRKSSPLEWEILNSQDIQRLIAVPLMSGGQVAGFIGVDNPRYAIQDDTQIRVLASFMMVRFRRERKEWQEE